MVDRNKILSDLSKFAVDAMSTFSGLKEEIETIVSLRVNKIIKKMNLVKKDEFDALKKMVQKVMMENEKLNKTSSRSTKSKKKTVKKKKTIKKKSKR
jgi:BMFP domain-containing protein YqiC